MNVNSKVYHEKFEFLPVNEKVKESLYVQTGRILEFVDSLPEDKMGQDRLAAVNFRTGEFIVDNLNRNSETNRTEFISKEMKLINKCRDSVVIIRNNPKNDRPSGEDLLFYLKNIKIKLSLIACHNGDLYAIYGVKPSFKEKYNELLEIEKSKTTEIEIAKRQTITQLYELNDALSEGHRYFKVVKL